MKLNLVIQVTARLVARLDHGGKSKPETAKVRTDNTRAAARNITAE